MDQLNDRGFSVIEIVIAMAIAVIMISGVIAASGGFSTANFGNQSTVMNSETNAEAVRKAQEVLEQAQALGRQDFNLVNNTSTTSIDGFYYKTVDVQLQSDLLTKLVTTTISWLNDHRATSTVRMSTLATNLENVNAPNTCNSVLSDPNKWKSPSHYSFHTDDMLPSPHANGIAISDIDVFANRLYITALTTGVPNPETFFIFSLPTNPSQMPTFLSRLDTATSSATGLNSVVVATTSGSVYAYIANAHPASFSTCLNPTGNNRTCGQLQIVDVTSPSLTNSSVKYTYKVPGVTGTGGQSIGTSVFYKDGIVYLGLAKTPDTNPGGDTEFNVIDVGGGGHGGTPTSPVFLGGYRVNNGVNAIFVKGDYAYIATPNTENLTILYVGDHNNPPTRVGGYTPPSGGNNGKSVYVVGSKAYLGRTFGALEFYIVDATFPSSPTLVGNPLNVENGNNASVNGLAVRSNLAFMITSDQFQVWNIVNPNSIVPWTPSASQSEFLDLGDVGGTGTTLSCEGDNFYLAIASSMGNSKDYIAIITPGP